MEGMLQANEAVEQVEEETVTENFEALNEAFEAFEGRPEKDWFMKSNGSELLISVENATRRSPGDDVGILELDDGVFSVVPGKEMRDDWRNADFVSRPRQESSERQYD